MILKRIILSNKTEKLQLELIQSVIINNLYNYVITKQLHHMKV